MKRRKFSKYVIVGGAGLVGFGPSALAAIARDQVELRNEPDMLVLCNKQTTIVLDKKANGAIVSLCDNLTGREFIAKDSQIDLFRIGLSSQGDTSGNLIWLTSRDAATVTYTAEENGVNKTARLMFTKLGGRHLQAHCTVSVGSDNNLILWQFALEGSDPFILEEVQYPMVVLQAPLDKGKYNAFVSGKNRGGIYGWPSQWPVGKGIFLNHPGSLASQFGCYYDSDCGFYSATQDSKGCPKMLHFQRTKSGMEYIWKHYCYQNITTPFKLNYAIAFTTFCSHDPNVPTEWRDAADIYKAWVLTQPWCARILAERDDLPGWLMEGSAVVKFRRSHTYFKPNVRLEYQADRYSHPEEIERWLKEYWHKNFPDVPLIVIFWGWEQISTWISPNYFPPYPSEDGLSRRIKAVKDVGGHPFFWPSGYKYAVTFGLKENGKFIFDDREYFEKVVRPHAVFRQSGVPFAKDEGWLDGGTNYSLCRGDIWTRNWLNYTAMELTKRGAELIQIDQVTDGCGPNENGTCYSSEHNHPSGPGSWFADDFKEQLKTMHEACGSLDMNIVLGFEGEQEIYLQQIGIQDYRDFEVYWDSSSADCVPANVFGYLYHEYVPIFQSNPEGKHGKPLGGNMLMMAWCLVNGQMPHLVSHWPLLPRPTLRNGNFEQWSENIPDGWSLVEGNGNLKSTDIIYCDKLIKHNGKASIRFENLNTEKTVKLFQKTGVGEYEREVGSHGPEVRKTYRLSYWFKAEYLENTGRVSIEALNAEGDVKESWENTFKKCADWRNDKIEFTIPEYTVRLQILLQVSGKCRVWFDEFLLEERGVTEDYNEVKEKPILDAEQDLGIRWVRLFHGEGRPYLLFGRMLRPPLLITEKVKCQPSQLKGRHEVQLELPAILHNAFRAPDGTEAVIAINITDKAQTGRMNWKGKNVDLKLLPWETKFIKSKKDM